MSNQDFLRRQLNRYKDLLANLSKRNREIYFKESKGSTINLSKNPFSKSMFKEGSENQFVPLKSLDISFDKVLKSSEINLSDYFRMDEVQDREALSKMMNRLDRIRLSDDRHQKEFGISGAWILGPFLCWRTSPQAPREDLLVSPIFKIPIDIKRNKRKKVVVEIEDEALSFNPSLLLALKQHLGLSIPDNQQFESVSEGIDYLKKEFSSVNRNIIFPKDPPEALPKLPGKLKIVKDEEGNITRVPIVLEDVLTNWELEIYNQVTSNSFMIIDVLYLDQLNASRMVLFNDYDDIIETGLDHPIINELFMGSNSASVTDADRSKLRELDAYKEKDNHFVVDIDSTQHRAIDSAKKSKAIVIQGPPGTGKSQTIVNLIADYLAKGKKVLFVSEKRPALDVVFNRLRTAKIDSQAVLIHSSELNKSDLYQSFLEMANSKPNAADEKEWEHAALSVDRVKKEINSYADVIQGTHRVSGLSYSDLMIYSIAKRKEIFDLNIYKKLATFEYDQLLRLGRDLDEVQKIFKQQPSLSTSSWIHKHSGTVNSISLENDLVEIETQLQKTNLRERQLREEYFSITGIAYEDAAQSLWNNLKTPEEVSNIYSGLWSSKSKSFHENIKNTKNDLIELVREMEKNIVGFESISESTSAEDIDKLEKYYRSSRGFHNWFSSDFWKNRKLRMRACQNWDGTNKQFIECKAYRESFTKICEINRLLGDIDNLSLNSHKDTIAAISKHISCIDELIASIETMEKSLPKKILNLAIDSNIGYNNALRDIKNTKKICEEISKGQCDGFSVVNGLSRYLTHIPEMRSLSESGIFVRKLIDEISQLQALDTLDIYLNRIADEYNIQDIREFILTYFVNKNEIWSEILETSAVFGWLDEVFTSSPNLRSFDRQRIGDLVSELQSAFGRHQNASRQAVQNAFAQRWTSDRKDEGTLNLLRKEAAKQRRVLSPREVMEKKDALKTMLDLKSCWLMSPLSISQILPLKQQIFDVIIFDEASQVRVEDAIPSIYRAASMIVVGDNKQMPPTNFFSGGVVEDDDEEEEISPSVLDLASQVYPSVLLEWHYRSRSEALIAFSNRAFYGGRLIAAPNPQILTATDALHFKQVPNAYFDGKEGNSEEADAVIDQLISLIREDSNRSFGIIAMGQAQVLALDEALNRKMNTDSNIRDLIEKAISLKDGEADVGLFIKNLENVQGDERDVILISIGYAPSEAGKKMRMNFGPLGKQGGGRRLNVAITRAKSQIYVFTSFSVSEIKTDEEAFSHNPDLCVLGRYLKYAEAISNGRLEVAKSILDSFPIGGVMTSRKSSRFALDVKRRLEELGYQVTAEIGSSGFFIDLGIHHPTVPSSFLLGIECDGAIFHSTPYARDRDKIREQLLTSRGWKIERVWSQDWSRDWRKEVVRIENRVKAITGGVLQNLTSRASNN